MIDVIHARFRLTATARVECYVKDASGQWVSGEGCKVSLAAVQGEPFGAATPNGVVEMLIANPLAAQMFLESPLQAQFDVVFSPVAPD